MPWWPKATKMEEGNGDPDEDMGDAAAPSSSTVANKKGKQKEKKSHKSAVTFPPRKQTWKEAGAEVSGDISYAAKETVFDIIPSMWEKGVAWVGRATVGLVEEGMKTLTADLKEDTLKVDHFADVKDTVGVVTGGGGGIGVALARELLLQRMKVVIADCSADRLEKAAAQLNGEGHPGVLTTVVCDITNEESVAKLAAIAFDLGHVSVLVCNAGVCVGRSQLDSGKIHQFVYETNVLGTQRTLRHFVSRMEESQKKCHVVVTTNNAALYTHTQGAFGVSAAALLSMTESLQAELSRKKALVDVHVLATGVVNTNVLRNSSELYALWAEEEVSEDEKAGIERFSKDVYSLGLPAEEVGLAFTNGLRRNYYYIASHRVAMRMAAADHFAGVTQNERRKPIRFGDATFKDPPELRRKGSLAVQSAGASTSQRPSTAPVTSSPARPEEAAPTDEPPVSTVTDEQPAQEGLARVSLST